MSTRPEDQPSPPHPDLPIAPAPCPHPPGSYGKIEVMRRRRAGGYSLYHPQDNPVPIPRVPKCHRPPPPDASPEDDDA